MALVNPPINGGTLVSLTGNSDDFVSCQVADNVFLCVARQITPNKHFYYLAKRDTTTGAFTYGAAFSRDDNTGHSIGGSHLLKITDSHASLFYGTDTNSTKYVNDITFDVATLKVTAVAIAAYSQTSRKINSYYGFTYQDPSNPRETFVFGTEDDITSCTMFMAPQMNFANYTAYNDGVTRQWHGDSNTFVQKAHDRAYFVRGRRRSTTAGSLMPALMIRASEQYSETTYMDYPAVNGFNSANTNYLCKRPNDTFMASNASGRLVVYKPAGVNATEITATSTTGTVGDFTAGSSTSLQGLHHSMTISDDVFVIGYFVFTSDPSAFVRNKPVTFQPTELHLRWFTRVSPTEWRVSDRSAGAGGFKIDIPTNPVWGPLRTGNDGLVIHDDFTYTLRYGATGTRLVDSYTQTIGSTNPVAFSTATNLEAFIPSQANTRTVRANSTAGSIVKYEVVGGSLPQGSLLENSSGILYGTVSGQAVDSKFTLAATDSLGNTGYRTFNWPTTLAATSVFSTKTHSLVKGANNMAVSTGVNLQDHGGLLWLKILGVGSNILIDSSDISKSHSTNSNSNKANFTGISLNKTGFIDSRSSIADADFVSWSFRKAPKFFDIITWTGNGTNSRQIAHSLGVEPGMILVKATSAAHNWGVYHRSVGIAQYAQMNTTAFSSTDAATVFAANPTSTAFTVGRSGLVNEANTQYVAYVFAHDSSTSGIIQCGVNIGNGSATSANVNLGWAPRFLLTRASNSADSWVMLDTARGIASPGADKYLYAQSNSAENSSDVVDLTANGFVFKNSLNTNDANQIYMAIR